MKNLLDKYIGSNLSLEEFDILSEKIDNVSDTELTEILSEEWNNFTSYHEGYSEKKGMMEKHFSHLAAAVITCLLIVSVFLGIGLSRANSRMETMASSEVTINSGNAGQMTMSLPDGTNVTLNAYSTISYQADFGIRDRKVKMTGEAFFDVTADADKKFVVNAPDMEITVHGTRFNVYAYPENSMSEVSLLEGRVSVVSGTTEMTVIPNEKVCINRKTGDAVLVKTDNEMETAWMKNKLLFVHDSLAHVFEVLQRRFGVTIKCSDDIDLEDLYTGSFRETNITDVLDVLKIHYDFKYKCIGNHITITHN